LVSSLANSPSKRWRTAAARVCCTLSSAAPSGAQALAQLDKNKDGKVSLDEYRAPKLASFDKLDTNHDGTINAAEKQAAIAQAQRRR
jgi:hypothetical protein